MKKGDLISKNLYSGTVGPTGSNIYTEQSAGSWSYGFWNSDVGYGFGNPENHFGDSFTTVHNTDRIKIPQNFKLFQNYPNPFNPSTTIIYGIKLATNVQLTVYNVLGQEVVILVNQHQREGNYKINFDASHLSSGTYIYKIIAGEFVSVKKLLLMK